MDGLHNVNLSPETIDPTEVGNTNYSCSCLPLIQPAYRLNGKNYRIWAEVVKASLTGSDKVEHLLDDPPSTRDPTFKLWTREDSIIKSWLWASMDSNIGSDCIFLPTVKDIWNFLRRSYDKAQDEASRFELFVKVYSTKQGTMAISEYATVLQQLWQEIDLAQPLVLKDPEDQVLLRASVERNRSYIFLAGLNPEFDQIRIQILGTKPLPSLEENIATIRMEETCLGIMLPPSPSPENMALFSRSEKRDINNLWCTHCQEPRHTKERYWALHDEVADRKKKTKAAEQVGPVIKSKFVLENSDRIKKNIAVKSIVQPEGSFLPTERLTNDQTEGEGFFTEKPMLGKLKVKKKNEIEQMGLLNKKVIILAEGMNAIKEKKSARESFVCGACGQLGHMRTNKNCPKYREDPETRAEIIDLNKSLFGRPNFRDQAEPSHQKLPSKKILPRNLTNFEIPEEENSNAGYYYKTTSKEKVLKVKCSATDNLPDNHTPSNSQTSDRPTSDAEKSDRVVRRRTEVEYVMPAQDYTPTPKRRRGGEVGLSNILESIVDTLRGRKEISYLFLKPVTKEVAPDYLDIISRPMDLSTIRDKVRKLEYKNRDDFRHDVSQIAFNAHEYNGRRNPGIPPLADQLVELCEFLLDQYDEPLTEAESGIE